MRRGPLRGGRCAPPRHALPLRHVPPGATGAVVATFATFESDTLRWLGEPARYDSSERGWRGFCRACGSSVCFGFKPRPERIYVCMGVFDDPDAFPAGFHDHRAEKVAWLQVDEHLPDAPGSAPG